MLGRSSKLTASCICCLRCSGRYPKYLHIHRNKSTNQLDFVVAPSNRFRVRNLHDKYSARPKMPAQTENPIQIGVVGRGMIGKTALIQRYLNNEFIDWYMPTDYEVYSHEMQVGGQQIVVNIGDAGGVPPNQELIDKNINDSHGFILVYDITRKETFDVLDEIRDHLVELKAIRVNLPLVLVANKTDLEPQRYIATQIGARLARRWRCPFYETSALTGTNVKEIFTTALSEIEEKRKNPKEEKEAPPCTVL